MTAAVPLSGSSGNKPADRLAGIGQGLAILGWAADSRLAMASGLPALEHRARLRQCRIVRWARIASPFYRDLYRGLPAEIDRFDVLPPVTKPTLMARFDDWLTDPAVTRDGVRPWLHDPATIGQLFRGSYLLYTTSGTTGEPAILVQDRHALAHYLASRFRFLPMFADRQVIARIAHAQGRTAALLATGGPYGGVVMAEWSRQRHPLGRGLTIFSVGDRIDTTVAGLNRQQPAILSGYASALTVLAEEGAAGRLRIDPALVFSIAEGLTPEDRRRIGAIWNARFCEAYGASEAPVIAFGCGSANLHLNLDWVTLEPVDERYRPVPIGEPSHTVLITNLVNRVQPVIRYDLGDSVTMLAEPCPCGSPLPALRVEGRSGDILALTTAHGETVRVLPLAIGSAAEEPPGLRRVQVIQTAPDALLVRLEPEAGADRAAVASAVQRQLAAFLSRLGLANVTTAISEELPRMETSGKFRQVYRQPGVQGR